MSKMAAWLEDAVFYEIYPQSFCDSNADGIGDIPGIISRLDYIRELGCNAIWMNPCFCSNFDDAGYDVTDYYTVAPRYGTNEDLKALFREVHARGMHILLDLVPGHTSYKHPWFQASMEAEENEYTHRYVWTDSAWAPPPEGLQTLRGISQRNGAAVVNFFSTQPALNYGFYEPDPAQPWQQSMDAPGPVATRNEIKKIMRFYLGLGCDGFRVDMAGSLVKNDPESRGTIALWQELRADIRQAYPEAVLVSEWGEPEKSIAGGFDMDFLLHFGPSHYTDLFHSEHPYFAERGGRSAADFVKKYRSLYEETSGRGLICIPSGNHDMERMRYFLSEKEMRLAFAFLLTMPGAPFIYYGDELGMRYLAGIPSREGGFHRTGARTPMQWDGSPNAGFSSAAPERLYLPIDPEADRPTAAAQTGAPDSLRSEVRRLIALRQAHPALRSFGTVEFLTEGDGGPLVYRRGAEGEKILIAVNPMDAPAEIACNGTILYAVGEGVSAAGGTLRLPGCSAAAVLES